MRSVVGIFPTAAAAEAAVRELRALGIPATHVSVLTPGAPPSEVAAVPVSDTEQPGMGGAVGGVVGGALGLSTGALAALFVPGVGLVMGAGLTAMALLGLMGVVGGAVAGATLEQALADGLPHDELFLYEDALRKGRSVVVVMTDDEAQATAARATLARAGAEDIDAAREAWWIGLRDAEAERYEGGEFRSDEPSYREGFEAALESGARGRSFEEIEDQLRRRHGRTYRDPAFRRGYERGRRHHAALLEQHRP